ncbi:NrsF family protein [Sphingomonas sp. UYP23]
MKTEVLIAELSSGLQPVPRGATRIMLRKGLVTGAVVAGVAVLFWPGLGPRPDMPVAVLTVSFWIKLLYTASIASLGFVALDRLSRPNAATLHWLRLLWPPVAVLAAVAAMRWAAAPSGDAKAFWMGSSWRQCPAYVAALALPVFVGLMWAMSRLAPTRLRAAGAAAGLVSGATGASIYALHCAETSPGFVLLWYSLGLGVATLLGATLGPRLLRW